MAGIGAHNVLNKNPFADLTLDAARRLLAERLAQAGREPAALEARLIVEEATGLSHADLVRLGGAPLDEPATDVLHGMAGRRLNGEPLSRIFGRREFFGLDLAVHPGVLDPRADTEALVRLALRLRPDRATIRRVLDLGVGSGAILLALLRSYPDAFGVGIDRSAQACRAARDNAGRCGLDGRSAVVQGDWTQACGSDRFDLAVSNPPYIAAGDLQSLAPEVRDHDPPAALDGGPDGLDAYRAILRDAARVLAPGGLLVLELGAGQRADVELLLQPAGFALAGLERDAGGHERAIAARPV